MAPLEKTHVFRERGVIVRKIAAHVELQLRRCASVLSIFVNTIRERFAQKSVHTVCLKKHTYIFRAKRAVAVHGEKLFRTAH